MATFQRENDQIPCKFTLPDKITVKQQLEYFSVAGGLAGNEYWFRLWEAAKLFIQDWEFELMPDFGIDLDTVTDPRISSAVVWAGMQVSAHINSLQTIPKNS